MSTLTSTFWDRYFHVYDVLNELLPYQYLLQDLTTNLEIKAGDTVLDVGAGTGNVSVMVAKAGGHPTGVDISPSGINICREKLPQCEFVVGDILQPLPFPDATFDKVVSNNVIYAIAPEKRGALAGELYRVLKPGGRIVIANIAPNFRPLSIYLSHLKDEIAESGFIPTLLHALGFIVPTIKMFYYNTKIQSQNTSGSYAFMSEEGQEELLRGAGFEMVSKSIRVYANNGVLTSARKP